MTIRKVFFLLSALAILGSDVAAAMLEIDHQKSQIAVAVSARFDSFVGEVRVLKAVLEFEPNAPLPAKAEVTFDFVDLNTGSKSRDAAMLKWLEYNAHPKAAFHLTGWNQAGGTNMALGTMTIHGISQPISFPVLTGRDGSIWNISGSAELDYRDFELRPIRKALILTVDPHLRVSFCLVGKLPAGK